jgi:hypothetical protein
VSDSQLGRLAQQAIALAAAREAEPAAQQRRPTALPAPEAAPAPIRTYRPVAAAPRSRSGPILFESWQLAAVAVVMLVTGIAVGSAWRVGSQLPPLPEIPAKP